MVLPQILQKPHHFESESWNELSWWLKIVVPITYLLVSALGVITWPIALIDHAIKLHRNKRHAVWKNWEFKITPENLRNCLTLKEVEAAEHIDDPLGAVPDLPFGYLNAGWVKFKENLQPGDELWSFAAPWMESGLKGLCRGYVIVRGDEIGRSFITDYRD